MLTPDTRLNWEPFLDSIRHSSTSLLMLDYDGTLAPFRRKRDQAFPYPGVVPILQEIVRTGRTRLVIISGRDAGEMNSLLDVRPRPEIWGLHGLQRWKSDGTTEMPRLEEDVLEALSDADRWLAYQQLEHAAETKTGSRAVHWRGLGEDEAEQLRGRVLLGWKSIAKKAHLDLLEFDGGIEIRAPEADKGDAVRTLLHEIGPNVPAAYLGDDTTDERAFRAIQGRGLSVLVRPKWRQTAAALWLKPPEELLEFLANWLDACRARHTHGGETAAAVTR